MRGFGVLRRDGLYGRRAGGSGLLLGLVLWAARVVAALLFRPERRGVGGEYLGRRQMEAAGVRHRGRLRGRGVALGQPSTMSDT
ncbi:hypothetical protein, partial [Streptomyces scabiei]